MSSYEDHCKECLVKMGDPFCKVHNWLDSPVPGKPFGEHRRLRHNTNGVNEVRKMWGDKAAKAAMIHIVSDFGCVPTPEQSSTWTLEGDLSVPKNGMTILTDKGLETC